MRKSNAKSHKKPAVQLDALLKKSPTKHLRFVLVELIFKTYVRTWQYIVFGFFQPIIIFAVFYFLFTSVLDQNPSQVVPGFIILAPVSTSLMAFSTMLSTWKRSILLKRISITPITSSEFAATFIFYFLITAMLSSFWTVMWATIFIASRQVSEGGINYTVSYVFQKINWGYLILALVQIIFICDCISLCICGLIVGVNRTQAAASGVFFPSIFFSGLVIPASELQTIPVLKYMSYIFPLKYPAIISNKAWQANIPNSYLYDHVWLAVVAGFAYAFVFLGVALKTFRWNNK